MSLLLGTQGKPAYDSRPEVDLVDGSRRASVLSVETGQFLIRGRASMVRRKP